MSQDPLATLQGVFQDYILGRDDSALTRVESSSRLSAERRLDIYFNAYRARLAELLADTHERVALYIGDERFDDAARRFIEQHPPTSRNLRDYGGAFPAFLATLFAADPEIAELAEMDRCLRDAFDAIDADALQVGDLAALPADCWDVMVFTLHPTLRFLSFHWNTPAIWQHLNDGVAPPAPISSTPAVHWAFWRLGLQPHFRSLTPEEYAALHAIGQGRAFGEICRQVGEAHPSLDLAPHIGAWLRGWLENGLLEKRRA